MELRQLRYFDALCETLNFTRAAERLHVTQSTLSHQIRQMEDELGEALFDRRNKMVRITEAGELFRSFANSALSNIDQGINALKIGTEQTEGEIRIGATASFSSQVMPACVADFWQQYPGVRVSLDEASGAALEQRVASGDLDMAVSYRPTQHEDLWFEPLLTEQLKLVVPPDHPLGQRRRVRMIELHQMRMVLASPGFQLRQVIDDCLQAARAQPVVVAHFETIAPMLALIRLTGIAGILGEMSLPTDLPLRAIALEDPAPSRTPGLLWKRGTGRSPIVRRFAVAVRSACESKVKRS